MSYKEEKNELLSELENLESHNFSGKNILVVDDNALNREIDLDLLSLTGASVYCACDGAEAIEVLEEKGTGFFNFILMDINMPNMNGYEAARAIRAKGGEYYSDIPIIAFTSNSFSDSRQEAFDAGMTDFLEKPVEIENLSRLLDKLIK